MSLYDFWDKGISQVVRTKQDNWWLSGWTHVQYVSAEHSRDQETWKREGPMKTFDLWMQESVKFACEKAYVHPSTKQKLAGPGSQHGVIDIDEHAFQAWKEEWLKLLLISGARV